MTTTSFKIAVLCHLFYPDGQDKLFEKLDSLKALDVKFYFNIVDVGSDRSQLMQKIRASFPGSVLIQTPHKGRDIGGKLSLLDVYFNIGDQRELLLFIHDKQSPHISNASYWVDELLRIIDRSELQKVMDLFAADEQCGIVCARKFIQNEYDPKSKSFRCTSNEILKDMIRQHQMELPAYDYVAGTIFWARSAVYEKFFSRNNLLKDISLLEKGNVLDFNKGTRIHAWERFLSWICVAENYKITGIE